jgi:hypothetical protein
MQDASAFEGIESRYATLATINGRANASIGGCYGSQVLRLGRSARRESGHGAVAEHDRQGVGGVGGP